MQGEKSLTKKALLIGISEYEKKDLLPNLEFCENDANEMNETLIKNGYSIEDKLIRYVTIDRMRASLKKFFLHQSDPAYLLFYFSGHGLQSGKDNQYYLATSDTDPSNPFDKGFPFIELAMLINQDNDGGSRKIIILDCCHSGAALLSVGGDNLQTRQDLSALNGRTVIKNQTLQGEGKFLLAACLGSEEANISEQDNLSVFTRFLIEGLRGEPDCVDLEGVVTPSVLAEYIYREFTRLEGIGLRPKQDPVIKVESSGDKVELAVHPEHRSSNVNELTDLLRKGQVENFNSERKQSVYLKLQNLRGCSVRGVNLSDANLISCDLELAILSGIDTNLSNAMLSRAVLKDADLSYANLRNADLLLADLTGADLTGADLSLANLRTAILSRAILREAKLAHARMTNATLVDADLTSADLSFADLSRANLSGANLKKAKLFRTNLSTAKLPNAILFSAQLCDASISDVDLSTANLRNADLYRANLCDANLSCAKLGNARLCYALLSYANLSKAELSDANLSYANLSDADLTGADLRNANCSYVDFSTTKGYQTDRNKLTNVPLQVITTTPVDHTQELSSFKKLLVDTVYASGHDGNVPKNTLENELNRDPNKRWSCYGIDSWIVFSLKEKATVCAVNVIWWKRDKRRYKFEIHISPNSGREALFSLVYEGESSGMTTNEENYYLKPCEAKQVKIIVNKNTQNNWASINMVEIYGQQ